MCRTSSELPTMVWSLTGTPGVAPNWDKTAHGGAGLPHTRPPRWVMPDDQRETFRRVFVGLGSRQDVEAYMGYLATLRLSGRIRPDEMRNAVGVLKRVLGFYGQELHNED